MKDSIKYLLCDITWCIHNGVHGRFTKCFCYNVSIKGNKCDKYECQRTKLIELGDIEEDKKYGGCKYCPNKTCKHKEEK